MHYFDKYVSNSLAGTSNQSFFINENEDEIHTGRLFYKIYCGGSYSYSFLFSNIIDSTYSDGTYSHKNLVCDSWTIVSASYCILKNYDEETVNKTNDFQRLTFDALSSKEVMPGEFFSTDDVTINAEAGDYICIEVSFKGKMIPCHPESIIPTFVFENGKWVSSKSLPHLSMIGCDRKVKLKIGFFGDSITQGIGTKDNSYSHWCALLADMLGKDYSYWNLGIGFGRAEDASSDGAWLFKAKQTDLAIICFGVNDILNGRTEYQLKADLFEIVSKLKKSGKKIILQTIPPFDYDEFHADIWRNVNSYIKNTLSSYADMVFDTVPVLRKDEINSHMAKYGSHPDSVGCKYWADALFAHVEKYLQSL